VRGAAAISISVADEGEVSLSRVTVDGVSITPAAQILLDTSTLPDGQHTVVVEAEDASRQRNRAQAQATFRSETRWWMTDTTPPVIRLAVPTGIVTGAISISLETADEGAYRVTRFTLDDVVLPVTRQVTIDTARLADGEHVVVVEAEDDSRQRNRSQARAILRSDNLPPTITVRFDPAVATQGRTQALYLTVSEPVSAITATLGGRVLTLAQAKDSYWAVFGFAPDAESGSAVLSVRAVDVVGHRTQVTATQAITRFNYPEEYSRGDSVDLTPEKAALSAYSVSEAAFLDTVFAPVSALQLWQGLFSVPIQGRQTSPFAIRRSYNGGPLDSHHGGVDIAADFGTPVPASNRGRVVLAEALKVRGGAVIIDHGMGVYSCYYHLSEIKAKKGQMIEKGQIVGLVGSEGLSTGPHLHWEMRVTGRAVDPWQWTKSVYPLYP
jgi:murein DD-endopeptidase MepM/ murein hydrolase activator NlpD